MSTETSIAVVVPARNASFFLRDALDSVYAQDHLPSEVVVVDDGSADDTREVAEGYGRGVTCLEAGGAGSARARNLGIAATRSPLVAFLDADDLWVPEKSSRQIALLKAHPDLALVFSDMRSFEDGRRASRTYFQERGFKGACTASSIFLYDMVSTPTVIVRREILNSCGGFDESLGVGQDTDLWFRIALDHRFAAIAEPLVQRRFHAGNITRDARRLAEAVVDIWGRYLDAVVEREPHMRRELAADYASKRWHHLFLEGVVAIHEGRPWEARRHFAQAILARPGRLRTYAFLGATFLGQEALRKLSRVRAGGDS
jgi:glycosyltransferase involved in cell wall biosynthesis